MLVNVTGHSITLDDQDGSKFVLRPSGANARIVDNRPIVAHADCCWPIRYLEEREIVGLPEPNEGTIYIASNLVARLAAARGRRDVVAPDVSRYSVIRDGHKNVLAVRGFVCFSSEVGGV